MQCKQLHFLLCLSSFLKPVQWSCLFQRQKLRGLWDRDLVSSSTEEFTQKPATFLSPSELDKAILFVQMFLCPTSPVWRDMLRSSYCSAKPENAHLEQWGLRGDRSCISLHHAPHSNLAFKLKQLSVRLNANAAHEYIHDRLSDT